MPVKPSERHALREDNLRSTLVRKIDQKILDTPEGEAVVFHFRDSTPVLMARSLASEYAANGWVTTLTESGGELVLELEPDTGQNQVAMSTAEEELSNYSHDLQQRGAVETKWGVTASESRYEAIYQASVTAVFCTSGCGQADSGSSGKMTLEACGHADTPEVAAMLCCSEAQRVLESVFLTLQK